MLKKIQLFKLQACINTIYYEKVNLLLKNYFLLGLIVHMFQNWNIKIENLKKKKNLSLSSRIVPPPF